jgi:mRNA interferase RelE/StbE
LGRSKEKPYRIETRKSAVKELQRLPASLQQKVEGKINELIQNPFPSGARKLAGGKGIYRIRIGDHRIVYKVEVENRLITVERIRHRREVYR